MISHGYVKLPEGNSQGLPRLAGDSRFQCRRVSSTFLCRVLAYWCWRMWARMRRLREGRLEDTTWDGIWDWGAVLTVYSLLLKMAIEIVDFPIKNGDFPYVKLSQSFLPWQSGIFFLQSYDIIFGKVHCLCSGYPVVWPIELPGPSSPTKSQDADPKGRPQGFKKGCVSKWGWVKTLYPWWTSK